MPQRYVLAVLLLLGSISVSLVRNGINVAILDMVNNSTVNSSSFEVSATANIYIQTSSN